MKEAPKCLKCGAPLTREARAGACPNCLFAEVVNDGGGDGSRTGAVGEKARQLVLPGDSLGTFGNYELIEEIARGGMGVVFKARQVSLDRVVALKLLLGGVLSSPEFIRRFRLEAAAAGGLQHPNIVAIHEVGLHEGQHFIAMEFVEGPTLATVLTRGRMSARRAVGYIRTVAEAIDYAHSKGVLHRDLTPSNILIDTQDQPRVTDFGLAKKLEGDLDLTLTGQVLGSPGYLPPEQASGRRGNLSRTADVYSLGAILYHMLTGRPPFQADTLQATLEQVRTAEPVPPRRLNVSLARDVETICLKCLEKEPDRRYPSAAALAAELGRFLNGEPIQARPVGRLGKTWSWCRRKPVLASLAATTMIAVLSGLWFSLAGFAAARQESRAAAHSAEKFNRVADLLREMIATAEPASGKGADFTVRSMLDGFSSDLDQRLANEPEVEALVRAAIGSAYLELCDMEPASNHLFRALALVGTRVADDSLEAAIVCQSVGEYYGVNEQAAASFHYFNRAYPVLLRQLPPYNWRVLQIRNQLAACYRDAQDFPAAYRLLDEVLVATRQRAGVRDFDLLRAIALRWLAGMYRAEGRFEDAHKAIREWRQATSIHHGVNHQLVILADFQEALLSRAEAHLTGQPQYLTNAIAGFEAVLQAQSKSLPADHVDTLETSLELAVTHLQAGHTQEARRLIFTAYAAASQKLGQDHPMTRRTTEAMKAIYQTASSGQLESAFPRPIDDLP